MTDLGQGGAREDDELLEGMARILWYEAGAVIPFDDAAPEVRKRYFKKAEVEWSEIIGSDPLA